MAFPGRVPNLYSWWHPACTAPDWYQVAGADPGDLHDSAHSDADYGLVSAERRCVEFYASLCYMSPCRATRAGAKRSHWRGATFDKIRRTFVKVAVRVEELKGRIKQTIPASYPQAAIHVAMTGAITHADPECPRQAPPEPVPTIPSAFNTSPNPPPSTRPPLHAGRSATSRPRIKEASVNSCMQACCCGDK